MQHVVSESKLKFIRGFSDKTRLQILECIREQEMSVSQIVEQLQGNQSNISQHLSCLKECGLIVARQEGKYMYYSLRNAKVKQLLDVFEEVFMDIQSETEACKHEIMGDFN